MGKRTWDCADTSSLILLLTLGLALGGLAWVGIGLMP